VVVGVTPPSVPTVEQARDYFRNGQTIRVITSSLCAQEFNKVRNIEVAKKIWDILREAHEGTSEVREGKMDLLQGEVEHFVMHDEGTVRQIYDRLMVLVLDIRSLGSTEWEDHKMTKRLLRAFTPRNSTLSTMIRKDHKLKIKTHNQLLGKNFHQELVEMNVAKSLSHKVSKNIALNTTSSDKVESKIHDHLASMIEGTCICIYILEYHIRTSTLKSNIGQNIGSMASVSSITGSRRIHSSPPGF
jgi:hypothetical protein